jgi:hypothetical protein
MLRKRLLAAAGIAVAAISVPFLALPASAAIPGAFLTVSPNPIVETDSGHVSFALYGSGFSPLMQVELSSPGLNTACRKGNSLHDPIADFNGNFNISVDGDWCVPGTYWVVASEQSSPYQSMATAVTITPPGPAIP